MISAYLPLQLIRRSIPGLETVTEFHGGQYILLCFNCLRERRQAPVLCASDLVTL